VVGYDIFDPQYYLGPPREGMTSESWVAEIETMLADHCPWQTPSVFRMNSVDAAGLHEDGSVFAVWFDSNHEEEHLLREIEAWMPKIAPGGIMAGHDLGHSKHPGVRSALEKSGLPYRAASRSSWVSLSQNP
jgi:hypothetical protein